MPLINSAMRICGRFCAEVCSATVIRVTRQQPARVHRRPNTLEGMPMPKAPSTCPTGTPRLKADCAFRLDDERAVVELHAEVVLELQDGHQRSHELRIEAGHDRTETEQERPTDGRTIVSEASFKERLCSATRASFAC